MVRTLASNYWVVRGLAGATTEMSAEGEKMYHSEQDPNLEPYLVALNNVIKAADRFLEWLDGLDRTNEEKAFALHKLSEAIEVLHARSKALNSGAEDAARFLRAAGEMQAGYILVEAARVANGGDRTGFRSALDGLRMERVEISDPISVFPFEKDLLQSGVLGSTDEQALKSFKDRAGRTLDNMVLEARDVISTAVEKFTNDLDSFVQELGELANSLSDKGATETVKAGIEKIVSGIKALAEFLKSDSLQEAIDYLREMTKHLDLEHVLAKAFGCEVTKVTIGTLELGASVNRTTLSTADTQMVDLSSRYVLLLKYARRVLTAVGAVGGILVLTGVAAHYTALAVPIAYAVVALTTVIIGMNFAAHKMRGVIASL